MKPLQISKKTIQMIEKAHKNLRKTNTCNTCTQATHEVIRGVKKTIKKIEKANKNLKKGSTKMSWRWGHWQCHHENLDKLIEKYHQISNHQMVNHVAEHQQGIQAGLEDWKENSKRIRKEAITELAKIAKLPKLEESSAN